MSTTSREGSVEEGRGYSVLELWKIQATIQQNQLYQNYGNIIWWSGTPTFHDTKLQELVGLFLYAPPPVQGRFQYIRASYTEKEQNNIEYFTKRISKNFIGYTKISLVFICTKKKQRYNIERVMRITNSLKERIIDTKGHEYKDWSYYLKNNKLPKRFICYPSDGVYRFGTSRELCLEFGVTPAVKKAITKILSRVLFIAILLISIGLFVASATYFSHNTTIYIVASVLMFICGLIIRHLIIRSIVRFCCCYLPKKTWKSPDYLNKV